MHGPRRDRRRRGISTTKDRGVCRSFCKYVAYIIYDPIWLWVGRVLCPVASLVSWVRCVYCMLTDWLLAELAVISSPVWLFLLWQSWKKGCVLREDERWRGCIKNTLDIIFYTDMILN